MRAKWYSGNTTVTFTRFLITSSTFLPLAESFAIDQGAFETAQHQQHLGRGQAMVYCSARDEKGERTQRRCAVNVWQGTHSDGKRHGPGRLVLDNVWEPYGDCPWPASQVTDVICPWQTDRRDWKGAEKSDFEHRANADTFFTSSPQVLLVLPWSRKWFSLHELMPSLLPLFIGGFGAAGCPQVMR